MITLPLQDKLALAYSARYSLNTDSYKVNQGATTTLGISPNMENEDIDLTYPSLLYSNNGVNECTVVETALKSTAGVIRISYNNLKYRIGEKYNVIYHNAYAIITFTLTRVA